MKKINLIFSVVFLILSLFACKQRKSMKEYIEKGFAKPILGDAVFTNTNKTNDGRIYFSSKEAIEVQFSIKNPHNQELRGAVEIPQEQKALFEREPEIKELTATNMVVAFNFSPEAEPKEINKFLGASVEMTVKIFESSTGRFCSSKAVTATCNTPPPSIRVEDVIYKEDTDEYLVTLPRGEGVHQDLKEVQFTLSSDYGNETAEPKIVSMIDSNERGKQYALKIKGSEDWQLKNPSGQRNIKAIVWDRAGLKSEESDKEQNKTKRVFTSIKLLPDHKDISVRRARETGIPVPRMLEFEEFFYGDTWKKESGYSVEYSCSPEGFVYDSSAKVFKNSSPQAGTTYQIKVTLKQGSLYSTPVESIFIVRVYGDNVVGIDENSLIVNDTTTYPSGKPRLQFRNLNFQPLGDVETATVTVPYTTFDTTVHVEVRAVSEACKGQNEGSSSYWSPEQYKTEYARTVGREPGSSSAIEFTIHSEDNNFRQKYKIFFVREVPPKVKVAFDRGILLDGSTARAEMTWKYAGADFSFTAGGQSEMEIAVGKDENVEFNITVGNDVKIKEVTSSLASPPHTLPSLSGNRTSFVCTLKATADFTLTIKLIPVASVKWKNYLAPTGECGYTSGTIKYGSGQTPFSPTSSNAETAVVKGEPVIFEINDLNPETHFIEKWRVNDVDVRATGGEFKLESDNKKLTILNAQKHYEVEVFVTKFCTVTVRLMEGTTPLTDHDCDIEVKNTSGTISPTNSSANLPQYEYKKIRPSTELAISATLDSSSIYEIQSWTYKETGGDETPFVADSDGKYKKVIDKDTTINVLLKKKMFDLNLEFSGEESGVHHNYIFEVRNTDATPNSEIHPKTAGSYEYAIEANTNVKLKVVLQGGMKQNYVVKEWQRKNDSGTFETIAGSSNQNEIATQITKATEIKVVLKPQFIFKFTKLSDDTDGGQMKITKENGIDELATVGVSSLTQIVTMTERKVKFNISGLRDDNMVVGYKRNDNEVGELFNSTTGLWKTEGEVDNLKPGDTFEVVVAKVQKISLSVRQFDHTDSLYDADDFKLTVTKDGSTATHMLFPNKSAVLELRKSDFNNSAKSYDIYLTKDTTIKLKLEGLGSNKEIGAWKKDTSDFPNTGLNDLNEENKVLIGKNDASYKCEAYGNFALMACIRDYETVELWLRIRSASVNFFDIDGGFGFAKAQDEQVAGINIRASGTELVSGNNIDLQADKDHTDRRLRVRKGTTVKLEAVEKNTGPTTHVCFAFWRKKKILPDDDGYDNVGELISYSTTVLSCTMDKSYRISGQYTKKIIVVMHDPIDKNGPNFPSGTNDFGKTKIEIRNSADTFAKVSFNGIANKEEVDYSPNPHGAVTDKNIWRLDKTEDNAKDLISEIGTDSLAIIQLELEGIDSAGADAHAHWKYSFGGDGDPAHANDTASSLGPGKPTADKRKVKLGIHPTPGQSTLPKGWGVLHLWLYEATP